MKSISTKKNKKSLALALMAGAASMVGISHAQTVNVNFNGFTGGNPGPQPQVESTLEGPAGGLGTRWNQFSANSSTGTLVDSLGSPTTVGFTTDFSEGRFNNDSAPLNMFETALTDFGRGQTKNLTITGLGVGGLYDIWLVSYRDSGVIQERLYANWATTNTTASAPDQFVDNREGNNNSTFVDGYNFVLFEGVVADDRGQITFDGKGQTVLDGADNDYRHGLNGFQIQGAVSRIPLAINVIDYDPATALLTLTWTSSPGENYAVKLSEDMIDWSSDLDDGIAAGVGPTTTATFDLNDAGLADASALFFRVEKQ